MRNYCTCYFSRIDVFDFPPNPPTLLQQGWYIGLTPEAAHDLAVANIDPASPYIWTVTDLGRRYFLLNRELFIAIAQSNWFPPIVGTNTVGLLGGTFYAALTQFGVTEGVDTTESPKKQEVYPFDGKPKQTIAGKGPKGHIKESLILYLTLLWQTYRSEHKWIVANQVLTELNRFMDGKVTEAQVLDFLSKLPPT